MTTLEDLKKKLEEAQSNVASLEKEIASKTPHFCGKFDFLYLLPHRAEIVRRWCEKHQLPYSIDGVSAYGFAGGYISMDVYVDGAFTSARLRDLADKMEENV